MKLINFIYFSLHQHKLMLHSIKMNIHIYIGYCEKTLTFLVFKNDYCYLFMVDTWVLFASVCPLSVVIKCHTINNWLRDLTAVMNQFFT